MYFVTSVSPGLRKHNAGCTTALNYHAILERAALTTTQAMTSPQRQTSITTNTTRLVTLNCCKQTEMHFRRCRIIQRLHDMAQHAPILDFRPGTTRKRTTHPILARAKTPSYPTPLTRCIRQTCLGLFPGEWTTSST